MKCIKRQVVIVLETMQFHGNFNEIEKFCGGCCDLIDGELIITTIDGPLHVLSNDFIIKNEYGTLISCTPEVFYEQYDYVESPIDLKWGDRLYR